MVVEEVGRLYIPVENASSVDMCETIEQKSEVVAHVVDEEFSIVESKIQMAEVWENGHNLVMMSEGCQKWANVWRMSQFM